MEDDSSKRGVVIKGPWKDSKVEQGVSSEIDVREDLKMIAEMHKVLLHQLIFTLKETGYDIESDAFVKESENSEKKDGKSYANLESNNLMKILDKKNKKK